MHDNKWLSRTSILIGEENLQKLINAHVLVVGMGGVGSFAAEFIARSGVGHMTIVDGDKVEESNRNRQLPALSSTQGQSKVKLMADRIRDINPAIELNVINEFVTPDAVARIMATAYDYMIDAIDSITPKITFIQAAYNSGIPLISSMGAGGKLDPTLLEVVDISKTKICPFAQQIRKNLKNLGIYKGVKVVYSTELPDKNSIMLTDGTNYKKSAYGTISYLPAAFGAATASVAIRDLINKI